ncbi:MAG: hypothetical protein GF383_10620 [Candidatus Lokiarchaeota archaeon]|nr:hypothetical protein [Candidatus Lokiarchaeota archaeon]MBD3341026.1 hypothetical protein [Candidatus Lokiarchaeota archaeon]
MDGEFIHFYLYDIGSHIDLTSVTYKFPGIPDETKFKSKGTPKTIYIPKPLSLKTFYSENSKLDMFESLSRITKIYEDGVISFVLRMQFTDLSLEQLKELKYSEFIIHEKSYNVKSWIRDEFQTLSKKIEDCVTFYSQENYVPKYERYTCFCITSNLGSPTIFLEENKKELAILLTGENAQANLHNNQINNTLDHSFSYTDNDLSIFDYDRTIIFDSTKDYGDILLIIELANYQLLELRVLDGFLDGWLNVAKEDIRKIFFKGRLYPGRLNKKLGRSIRIRYDMTFILERIENVSKIIGDYYLAQIFTHLGELFQLEKWSESIRNRLRILDDIYLTGKTNINEKLLLYVELLLGIIEIVFLIFLLMEFF